MRHVCIRHGRGGRPRSGRIARRSSATRWPPTTRRSGASSIAAYLQYADLIARDVFSPYLADLLDLDTHARHGHLIVVEADGRIRGFGAFYPDASAQGLGWPPGWASGRALAVHPDARGHGVARALLAANERLARESGAPVFAFHTASFMTDAIALYDRLGFRRAPEFDFDMAAHYGGTGAAPIMSIAYIRPLTGTRAHVDDVRHARCTSRSVHRSRGTTNDHDLRQPAVVRPFRISPFGGFDDSTPARDG